MPSWNKKKDLDCAKQKFIRYPCQANIYVQADFSLLL